MTSIFWSFGMITKDIFYFSSCHENLIPKVGSWKMNEPNYNMAPGSGSFSESNWYYQIYNNSLKNYISAHHWWNPSFHILQGWLVINLALFILFQVIQILKIFPCWCSVLLSDSPVRFQQTPFSWGWELPIPSDLKLLQNVARHLFCDVQTFQPEPNPSECLHHVNMATILCHFSSEQAKKKKTPQKARVICKQGSW